MTKYRIKEKNSKFYPQRKGWATMWFWEFITDWGWVVHPSKNYDLKDGMFKWGFGSKKQADEFIEKHKRTHYVKIHKLD